MEIDTSPDDASSTIDQAMDFNLQDITTSGTPIQPRRNPLRDRGPPDRFGIGISH